MTQIMGLQIDINEEYTPSYFDILLKTIATSGIIYNYMYPDVQNLALLIGLIYYERVHRSTNILKSISKSYNKMMDLINNINNKED